MSLNLRKARVSSIVDVRGPAQVTRHLGIAALARQDAAASDGRGRLITSRAVSMRSGP